MSNLVKEIMMALPDDFIRCMRNWARYKVGSSLGYAAVNLAAEPSGGYREARLPILSGEAEDIDRAIQTLEIRYRRPVELFWAWEEIELTVLARRCGGIERRTFAKRVMEGHVLVRSERARRRDVARRQMLQASTSQFGTVRGLDGAGIPV